LVYTNSDFRSVEAETYCTLYERNYWQVHRPKVEAETEKFHEDVNTILINITPIFICAEGAHFKLHLSGRIWNEVQLVERKKKWVLYDNAGNVVIVATNLKTCRLMMERMRDERDNAQQESLSA